MPFSNQKVRVLSLNGEALVFGAVQATFLEPILRSLRSSRKTAGLTLENSTILRQDIERLNRLGDAQASIRLCCSHRK